MMHIKEPLLLIDKSSLCGGSGFPFSLSEWSFTICLTPYNRRLKNVLSASLNKTFLSLSLSCTKGHLNKCSIVCGSVPQSHMVSLEGLYPHLPSVTLALPTPVLSRLRHFHFAQLSPAPGGSCSLATIPIVVEGGRLLFISSHIVNLASLVVVSASRGLTHLRKLFLDFRRF